MHRYTRPPCHCERYCSFCGQEVAAGEAYWHINGWTICGDCLPDFARQDYAPFRHIHTEEEIE